jgi:long-chain acyl-CoA synthetase
MIQKSTLIHHFLEYSASRFPDKCALVHEEVRATYQQINSQANHLARFFIERGVLAGDRIVLLLENSLEYVVGYYAALKAGAVVVPMNTELKPDGLLPLLRELDARCLITSRKFERVLRAVDLSATTISSVVLKLPKLSLNQDVEVVDWDDVVLEDNATDLALAIPETSLGSIIYTSGSTGKPKGVMLTHRNIVANTYSIVDYLELTEKDIQMVVLPFFYVMGKSLLNTHFAVGGRVVINNKFAFPATVVNQMIEEKVTGFSGVPSTYAYLLHRSPLAARRDDLVSLRYCSQAGGHLDRTTKQKLLQVLPPNTKMFVMYGATEASARLSYVEPHRLKEKIDSIGQGIPGVTLKVLGENGQELSNGEVGEIVGSGENIMQGYWKDPQSSAAALSSYGYHTGDLGYRDHDGYYFVVGRKDNQLKVGGHRINTQEVEDAIMATGLAVEVAVMGIPDPLMGNKLVAVMASSGHVPDENSILSLCAKKLPNYKVPQEILFVKSLPKNASAKVDRNRCLEIVSEIISSEKGQAKPAQPQTHTDIAGKNQIL